MGIRNYSPAQKLRLMKAFVEGHAVTLNEACRQQGINLRTAQGWATAEKWWKKRRDRAAAVASRICNPVTESFQPPPDVADAESATLMQLEKARRGYDLCKNPATLKTWIAIEDSLLKRLERIRAARTPAAAESPAAEAPEPTRKAVIVTPANVLPPTSSGPDQQQDPGTGEP